MVDYIADFGGEGEECWFWRSGSHGFRFCFERGDSCMLLAVSFSSTLRFMGSTHWKGPSH